MDLSKLNSVLKNEPKYRYKQIGKAIYQELIDSWSQATNLPKDLRDVLEESCPLGIAAQIKQAADSSQKALIVFSDGLTVETVLIKHFDGRNTVCVSSQVGCALGCLFCATGRIGFKRNLPAGEIVEQVLFFARRLKKEKQKVTNIVFMGMGEPFLNYENVLAAIKILNDPEKFNLGIRRFSISTAGITHGIKKLAKEGLDINLAISLHAPDSKLRSRIMPINDKYPLEKILKAVREYIEATRRRVMFEYVMIKDLNDSPEQARQLAALIKGYLGFVNLISYNQTEMFKASTAEKIKKFKEILEKQRIPVVIRHRFGEGIEAACGQLAGKNKKIIK